jgi:hypothetical protein
MSHKLLKLTYSKNNLFQHDHKAHILRLYIKFIMLINIKSQNK